MTRSGQAWVTTLSAQIPRREPAAGYRRGVTRIVQTPYTQEDPLVFGEPGGAAQLVEARATIGSIRTGQIVWASGKDVKQLIDDGFLKAAADGSLTAAGLTPPAVVEVEPVYPVVEEPEPTKKAAKAGRKGGQ